MSADVITKFYYLVHGKNAPKNSGYKGIITTKSIVGFKEYTKRKEAKVLSEEAEKLNYSFTNFFDYTNHRIGATRTYSSVGWLDNPQKEQDFRQSIKNYFNKDGDIIWVPIISLEDFITSTEMKLFNEEDYAALFEKILPNWFNKAGFENSNIIWWMDHHVNTDNPHIHLSFFEKKKTIENGKLQMKDINNFKSMFWNEVFSKKRYLENTGKTVEAGFKNKDLLKQETYKTFKEKMKMCTEKEFINQLKNLYNKLPANGRLQYNSSHMIPFREDIDMIVDYLLKTPEVNERYKKFIDCISEFDAIRSKALNTNYSSMMKAEDKKLHVLLANTILQEFKNMNYNYWENMSKENLQMFSESDNNTNANIETLDKHIMERITIPIAKSLIKYDRKDQFFMRVPGGGKYIYLDKNKCTLISAEKGFYTAEITDQDIFDVYDSNEVAHDEQLVFNDFSILFSDGKPYLDSLKTLEIDRIKQAELWEQRQKDWVSNNHDWKSSAKKSKRASFAWMQEIEQEVEQARNEFLQGKEYTL